MLDFRPPKAAVRRLFPPGHPLREALLQEPKTPPEDGQRETYTASRCIGNR
jgi:hypothetical protein